MQIGIRKLNLKQDGPDTYYNDKNKYKYDKWCKIHKSSSHQTKDCVMYNREKDGAIIRKREEEKKANLVFRQYVSNEPSNITILGKYMDRELPLLVDTGASENFVDKQAALNLKMTIEETKPIQIKFGNGTQETSNLKARAEIKFDNIPHKIDFYVLKNLPVEFILGNEFLRNKDCTLDYGGNLLKIKKTGIGISFQKQVKTMEEHLDEQLVEKLCLAKAKAQTSVEELNIFKLYMNNNDKFKVMKVKPVKINVTNDIQTVQSYGYSISHKYLKDAQREIDRLLNNDIIERSFSKFSSPGFFIEKKNKDLRLVVDYRKINKYIEDDPWRIPNIEECIRNMGANKFFSQLDLTNGFNQIPIDIDSKQYTAFMLLGKQYQYKRIPFGIKPGPKMFQRHISSILEGIDNVFVYIDDIVVYSKSEEEHINILEKLLKRLYEHEIQINLEKSKFFLCELEILGYRVNESGIFPRKIYLENNIFKREIKTKKDLQYLLGVLNWYRKFVPDLSRRIFKVT